MKIIHATKPVWIMNIVFLVVQQAQAFGKKTGANR